MLITIRETADATAWVEDLLNGAIAEGISDLQLRLRRADSDLSVRARVNRVMVPVAVAKGSVAIEVINRIKTMARISTGPASAIADGLYTHDIAGVEHDLRIAVFPALGGETIAIRLPAKQEMPTLAQIKFNRVNARRLMYLLGMANGLLLLAGPMGAGKTTTMYAVLGQMGSEERNVFTVEDPIERKIPGATQIPINEESRNGWPEVLRGLRRSDLEVLMIGEIRDGEQARAAMELGNAGARVISSIHANDSVGAVEMLVELSRAEPHALGNQLRGVVSQRLVRLLHAECAGAGCADCESTGYKGVQPIHEVLIVDDTFIDAMVRGASTSQLRDVARQAGMESLWDAANKLIDEGLTDRKEAVRVLGVEPARLKGSEESYVQRAPISTGRRRRSSDEHHSASAEPPTTTPTTPQNGIE